MHTDWYRAGDLAEIDRRLDQFRDRLRLEHTEGFGRGLRARQCVSA